MRAFLRNLLRLAVGAIAVGLVLAVVALSMDSKVYTRWNGVNVDASDLWLRWSGNENREKAEDSSGISEDSGDKVSQDKDETNLFPITYKNVKKLDFTMYTGKLVIKEGDEFSVDVNERGRDIIVSEVKNGIWTLRETKGSTDGEADDSITVFGIDFQLAESGKDDHTEVYVTLPKDFKADDIKLAVGAGIIQAESLTADTGSITVGAGTCDIKELKITDNSTYKVDAGSLTIHNADIRNGRLTCSVGSITIDGSITGDSDISTSVGFVSLDLNGKESDYNYSMDCKLGTLTINGIQYNGINKSIVQESQAPNNMTLSCDVGSITMNID